VANPSTGRKEGNMQMNSHRVAAGVLALLLMPSMSFAQVKTIVSGGFRAAYTAALPEFERTGISVSTGSGASQGNGPNTIGAQLSRGVPADVVIMAREGLDDLVKAGRLMPESVVDLARTPVGLAVQAGAAKPDISTVDAFKRALLQAKTVAFVDSTVGIYLRTKLFPQLGIADQIGPKLSTAGAAGVVAGNADFTIQPLSELTNVKGLEVVGTIPKEIQYISVFSAAIVKGAAQPDAGQRLIDFFASEKARGSMRDNGMEPMGR
jgi:molybdate transport system substrate-binding protein